MSSSPTISQTPFPINVRRDLIWDFSSVDATFVASDPLVSYFWAAISIGVPPVERFFVKALKPTLETIKDDDKLSEDISRMIAQEVLHSNAHMKFNQHLASLGYDVAGATRHVESLIAEMTAGLSPIDMMGVVAAGEHGLYSFAQAFIRNPELRTSMHPEVDRLFLYHFLEESEHGAVSHDQYRYFKGDDYRHRLRTAARTLVLFKMLTGAVDIIAKGFGHEITLRQRLALRYYLWFKPGILRQMAGNILSYIAPWYRLTFTPQDVQLMRRWHEELYAERAPHPVLHQPS